MISGPNFRAFTERAANAYQWRHMVNGPFPPNVNPHSAEVSASPIWMREVARGI